MDIEIPRQATRYSAPGRAQQAPCGPDPGSCPLGTGKRLQDDAKLIWRAIETDPSRARAASQGAAFPTLSDCSAPSAANHGRPTRPAWILPCQGARRWRPAAGEVHALPAITSSAARRCSSTSSWGLISMHLPSRSISVPTGEIIKPGRPYGRAGHRTRPPGRMCVGACSERHRRRPSLLLPGP